jgi:regulatory protein
MAETDRHNARRDAIRFLRISGRSTRALVDRLVAKGHARATAQWAADEMVRVGLLDDRKYAEAVVRSQLSRKPAGRRYLLARLRTKGVPGEIAEDVVAAALDERDELDDAMDLARRKLRTYRPDLDPGAARRRLMGVLARRGFDADTTRRVVESLLDGWPGED